MASFTPKSPSKYSATQQANFAKNSDPAKGISLVIPRVFNNIGELRIKQHIIEANLGFVERVDVVPVAEGKYKRAFVHFAAGKWNMRDATARAALTALQAGESIKLEYESPWYWLVSISGEARPDEAPKPRERKTKVVIEPGNGTSDETRKNRRYDEWRSMPYKEKSQYDEFEKIKALSRQAGESKQNNTEKFKRANAAENRANAAENRLKRAKAAENRLKRANAAENRLNKTTKKGGRRKKRKTRRKKKSKKKCRKKRKKSRKTKSNKR